MGVLNSSFFRYDKASFRNFCKKPLGVCLLAFAMLGAAEREGVSVEDAFWAYDDGMVSYEELEDLLRAIDEGPAEACLLWETYGGDFCRKSFGEKLRNLNVRGNFGYSVSIDSVGGIRRERLRLSLGLHRFDGEVRLASENRVNPRMERFRIVYRDRKSFSVLGNIVASDIGSAISLEKTSGTLAVFGVKSFSLGSMLLTDSSFGGFVSFGERTFRFAGFGAFAPDGFRDAFLKFRNETSDVQFSYSRGWKTPLLYVSARSVQSRRWSARFQSYFHGNRQFSGIFHVPKSVEKNRAAGNASVKYRVSDWTLGLGGKYLVPQESSVAKSELEANAGKNGPDAKIAIGSRLKFLEDSLETTYLVRSGIRLFEAESLFGEWKWTGRFPAAKSLYEIRSGVSLFVDSPATVSAVLIWRGPQRKPLVFRETTQMFFSKFLSGKGSVELRGDSFRKLVLWRFGLEVKGKW